MTYQLASEDVPSGYNTSLTNDQPTPYQTKMVSLSQSNLSITRRGTNYSGPQTSSQLATTPVQMTNKEHLEDNLERGIYPTEVNYPHQLLDQHHQ
jgi:hypothetical protein